MKTITYSQVQDMVMQLPVTKLPRAYSLLVELANDEADGLSPQLEFMCLPLTERRRIMVEQAEKMIVHYEQTTVERQAWQGGDFADEY